MINSIEIENFQSHKHTTIEFSPAVTAIIGLNNHGKSAVLRALRKVIRNEPDGTSFIRDNEKELKISLSTNGNIITRSVKSDQSADNNLYSVLTPEMSQPLVFVKFGRTGIPEEVLSALHISGIQDFGDVSFDMNFQNQFDSLFLVVGQGLASTRGKVLSKITGLDKIQRAIQIAGAEEKRLTLEVKRTEENIKKLDLKQFDNLPQLFQDYDNIQCIYSSYNIEIQKLANIEALFSSLKLIVQHAKVQSTKVNAANLGNINISDISVITTKLHLCELTLQTQNSISHTNIILHNILSVSYPDPSEISLLQMRLKICEELLHIQNNIAACSKILEHEIPSATDISNTINLNALLSISLSLSQRINNLSRTAQVEVPDLRDVTYTHDRIVLLSDKHLSADAVSIRLQRVDATLQQLFSEEAQTLSEHEQLHKDLGVCPLCKKPF